VFDQKFVKNNKSIGKNIACRIIFYQTW